ncbi:putative S-adenosylmethionine-dependent methyltransferase [Aspergillus homomorphus CBS 101889]|uniref:S-adenosyl-L-methionine-dependent methyltransferase n=1 Tax=Aspergillus homomorphus (strain CBS 101889) TaxID=1450537 RepID=A0A395HM43_ASPHC|nr:S-adenosyl-L-methionine-dependent methyltransferase [Aspergillus homomorphus CBS 101889]RAL08295.1 S-adenosyl-L-methionine-dependent methyltransferase [Aspergillus homomorphus CBS 101889]
MARETVIKDPTFRTYTPAQATFYALARASSYPPFLYNTILTHHSNTGGQFHRLLDVGCGPGNATRDLAPSFEDAVGVDPGQAMIETARALSKDVRTGAGSEMRFVVGAAEECAAVIDEASGGEETVDLVVCAMSAHWFSMRGFWEQMRTTVKKGGTVAIWTCASLYCHPTTPNATAVQRALFHLEDVVLAPFALPENRLSRNLYDNPPLPWSVIPPVEGFSESQFTRLAWNRDGAVADGEDFLVGKPQTLEELERSLGSASMVTRWREANPDLAETDKDCVKIAMDEVGKALEDGGCDASQILRTGAAVALLLIKKD